MAIMSDPFGGVYLTGEDARAFVTQLQGPSFVYVDVKKCCALASELTTNGSVILPSKPRAEQAAL